MDRLCVISVILMLYARKIREKKQVLKLSTLSVAKLLSKIHGKSFDHQMWSGRPYALEIIIIYI